MTERKFYKTVIQVTVLSEEPYDTTDLEAVAHDIDRGDCSGHVEIIGKEVVNTETMATLLEEQGSDPGFFRIGEEGEDEDETQE